jgi:hypothetical protein
MGFEIFARHKKKFNKYSTQDVFLDKNKFKIKFEKIKFFLNS